jgi:O-antigen/teichoic acid export membrane protein
MNLIHSRTIIKSFFNNQALVFVIINIVVALLGFIRSFAFMNFFDFHELGIITLISTAAMLIGFFQLGLINGGYRIIALGEEESNVKTNNVVFSYFGVLSILLLSLSTISYLLNLFSDWRILLIINFLGIGMLITNWLTNTLIGAREYGRLNYANIVSAVISLLFLMLAHYFGLYGALFSLLIQPLLFVFIVFFTSKKYIPKKFDLDFNHIKFILSFGFIPFLSGVFFLFHQQIERWSINIFIGPEALGKIYLVYLLSTLWLLIPTSINSLFFPKSVKYFADGNLIQLQNTFKQYFLILIAYSVIGSLLVILILPTLVNFVFPKHFPYIHLVYVILPGLIIRNMCDPVSLYLNSIVKLKPILWSDIVSTFFYAIMIFYLELMEIFSLVNILICYSIYNLIKFSYLYSNLLIIKRKIKYDNLAKN